ncbi:MAG: preprotein translocase subunit YajC [Bacteroidales bacterium]
MNLLFLLEVGATAAPKAGGMGNYSLLIMMVLIFVVMYFFMMRPQQKKQKELNKFRNSLKKGDKVVTVGGIYGTVSEVKGQFIIMEVDNNVKIRVDKTSVVRDMADIPQK